MCPGLDSLSVSLSVSPSLSLLLWGEHVGIIHEMSGEGWREGWKKGALKARLPRVASQLRWVHERLDQTSGSDVSSSHMVPTIFARAAGQTPPHGTCTPGGQARRAGGPCYDRDSSGPRKQDGSPRRRSQGFTVQMSRLVLGGGVMRPRLVQGDRPQHGQPGAELHGAWYEGPRPAHKPRLTPQGPASWGLQEKGPEPTMPWGQPVKLVVRTLDKTQVPGSLPAKMPELQ